MVRSGFNEKGFTFLMEDTYFTVDDYLKLYNQDNKITDILANSKAKIDLYGCISKTKNTFKFMNKLDFYNLNIRLHLVKLTEQTKDVRQLIDDITNNKSSSMESDNNTSVLKTTTDILSELTTIKQIKEASTMIENKLQELLKNHKPSIRYGKILEDDQYSDPNTKDTSNRITTSFQTSLRCRLTDSRRFKDQARIVHTWERTLTPGSIWQFDLEHHLGKGIHLNQLYDFDTKNKNHPSGYFFIVEHVGDRKGRIVRNADKDFFNGYAPTQLHIEFDFKVCFLYELKNGKEEAALYRQKKVKRISKKEVNTNQFSHQIENLVFM